MVKSVAPLGITVDNLKRHKKEKPRYQLERRHQFCMKKVDGKSFVICLLIWQHLQIKRIKPRIGHTKTLYFIGIKYFNQLCYTKTLQVCVINFLFFFVGEWGHDKLLNW